MSTQLNQKGRGDHYHSGHKSRHAGKQHGVDNNSDHCLSPYSMSSLDLAREGGAGRIGNTVSFARGRRATGGPGLQFTSEQGAVAPCKFNIIPFS